MAGRTTLLQRRVARQTQKGGPDRHHASPRGCELNDQPVAMWITLNAFSHRPTGSTATRTTPQPTYTLDGALLAARHPEGPAEDVPLAVLLVRVGQLTAPRWRD